MSFLSSLTEIPLGFSTFKGTGKQFNLNWSSDAKSGEAEWATVGGKVSDVAELHRGLVIGQASAGEVEGKVGELQGSMMLPSTELNKGIFSFGLPKTVRVDAEVSCGEGTTRVSVRTPEGKIVSVDVGSNETKNLQTTSEVYFSILRFKIESVTEKVSNLHYKIKFQVTG